MKKITAVLLAILMLGLTGCGKTADEKNNETTQFTPSLDTNTTVNIDIAGFMGNFEALDQLMNEFNEIYPNVVFSYDHNTAFMLNDYLGNNGNIDIFMISDNNITKTTAKDTNVIDKCLDLSKEKIDVSFLYPESIKAYTVDDKLLSLPIMQQAYGIVVNKTLLINEGLFVPKNYEEFLTVMEALKEKGYTPLQGSQKHLYGELMLGMAMNILAQDKANITALENGDEKVVDIIKPVFEKLETIINNGYTDYELNSSLPEDNYDGSIMKFFEGEMPFYVCNTECVSGMKKRESKSESFTESPFEYEFMYAPLGEEGVYEYAQPWYGFSIRNDSDSKDMAVEFLRFVANADKLDNMAATKGLPSVVINGKNERYAGITNVDNVQSKFYNDGSISSDIREAFIQVCNDFGAGTYKNAEEAAKAFVNLCK